MTTDELFAQMEENPEVYLYSDEYCMLESDTSRVVVVPDRYTVFGVEGDTNVERVKFKFPKIVGDNVDLTTLNLRVNFRNADGKLDKYLVDDVEEAEEGYITFSWVIQDGLTPKKGQISFVVQALKATSEGKFEKKWSTTLNKVGQILEGLEVDGEIAEQNPDIIEAILTRIDELEKNGGGGSVTPGKDGREVELQNSGTAIQWRYVGEEEWKDLVQLSELRGKDGDPGEKGDPGQNGITPTIGENGNWFLGEEDTGKPSRGETGPAGSQGEQGPQGETGPQGPAGTTGVTPNIQIGEVTTLEPGTQATASITGTTEEPKLNLGIPKGEKGETGGGSGGSDYVLPIMTQDTLGGGKAVTKTNETVPVAVDPETGQLYVPEQSGSGESIEQNWKLITNVTIEEEVEGFEVTQCDDGSPFSFDEIVGYLLCNGTETNRDSNNNNAIVTFGNSNGYFTGIGMKASNAYRAVQFEIKNKPFFILSGCRINNKATKYITAAESAICGMNIEENSKINKATITLQAMKFGVGSALILYGR